MLTENFFDILLYRWQQTLQPFKVNQLSINHAFNYLISAYTNPGRYYHTLQHILEVLITIDTLKVYAKNLAAVQLAAWFHDIVYDTQAQDNEEKSADYACDFLTNLGLPFPNIATVKRLILNTKHHQAAADDFDCQVLLDADLAILAADPIQYQEYANAIRQEYAWVPEFEYIVGRKQVLQRFLQRDRIYFTSVMFDNAEQAARRNLQAEIEYLQRQMTNDK